MCVVGANPSCVRSSLYPRARLDQPPPPTLAQLSLANMETKPDAVVPGTTSQRSASRASFMNITRPSGAVGADPGRKSGYVGDPAEEKASLASSLVNLANTVMGTGILALPAGALVTQRTQY